MHPAFSVIFLTILIGAGQGLFLALYLSELLASSGGLNMPDGRLYVAGGVLSVALLAAGLAASFFHLGHPERAWRTATCWRTSWLSREVIALPAAMACTAAWTIAHAVGWDLSILGIDSMRPLDLSLVIGAAGIVVTFALFLCTGMIYACIKFVAEWATPLTVLNFTLLGSASGFTLATALSSWLEGEAMTTILGAWAMALTFTGALTRFASLLRNDRLKPRSSLQSAIGIRHSKIVQRAQGATAGSFNTREFFHHAAPRIYRSMRLVFMVLTFVAPLALLIPGVMLSSTALFAAACVLQLAGLVAERWYFFAQANHPQNLYYQYVS